MVELAFVRVIVKKRRIGVFTGSRSDFGLVLPIIQALEARNYRVLVFASGNHFSRQFGRTVRIVEKHCHVTRRWKAFSEKFTSEGIAHGLGKLGQMAARDFQKWKPEIVFLTGDRIELLPVAQSAVVLGIPIAHVGGGETTLGAFDQKIRGALTSMADWHFVGHENFRENILRSETNPDRVFVTGDTAIDNLKQFDALSPEKLENQFGFTPDRKTILLSFHPETLSPDLGVATIEAILTALRNRDNHIICTYPNADPGCREIIKRLENTARKSNNWHLFPNLGSKLWFSLLKTVGVLLGNSSSGIIEAPTFFLPVVNVGIRQAGRLKAENVIDVEGSSNAVEHGLHEALSQEFRKSLESMKNPYGDGNAGNIIASITQEKILK